MTIPYYPILALGGTFIVTGLAILFLVLKFISGNRIKHVITGLVFVFGGLGIVIILLTFIPSPQVQRQYISQMLSLNPEDVNLLTVYDWSNGNDLVTKSSEPQLLEKWVSIVQSCQSFNPNHPLYEDKYAIVLDNNSDDRFLYEVNIDKKVIDSADLRLVKRFEAGRGTLYLGTYRCAGLFEFISEIAARSD